MEVDFKKPLVHLISVMGHVQSVEYEGIHMVCFGCGEYGHKEAACPKFGTEVDRQPP